MASSEESSRRWKTNGEHNGQASVARASKMTATHRHYLDRRGPAWGNWYRCKRGRHLVHTGRGSANYDVALDQLQTMGHAVERVEKVVAHKLAWMTQRDVDDLCRAIRDLLGFDMPPVELATEPAYGNQKFFRELAKTLD